MAAGAKERIAVLGGGVGALSAAFYLTEQPGWSDKYEITVYQQGWRLGGKCASGHDLRPGYGYRIYEHGLHIFAGFYDQAFDLLRRAYDELDRPDHHPNQGVWDSFTPQDTITLVDPSANNPSGLWYLDFSPNNDVPGENLEAPPLIVMIQRMVNLVINGSSLREPVHRSQSGKPHGDAFWGMAGDAFHWLTDFVQKEEHELEGVALDAVVHALGQMVEAHMESVQSGSWDDASKLEAERFLLSAFLVQSVLHGISTSDVANKGYDTLDKWEWSEWLGQNALAVAQTQSKGWGDPKDRVKQLLDWAPIASLYDYVFGFSNSGDPTFRSFGAGTALRSAMLMISYKGHFFWKMRGAMGDVVIAPLYLALKKRGVSFKFFSRVTALNIEPHSPTLASIDYVEQVRLKDPKAGYQPLIEVPIPGWPQDLPLEGWPDHPLWEQVEAGDALRDARRDFEADHLQAPGPDDVARQLKAGVDFDKAIVGISVGGLKQVCASFPARLPASKWGKMFATLSLTRTCAMQLWLTRTMDDLGSGNADRTLTGADQPYSSWSDMSHLLSRETWNGAVRPRSIAYFCGQIQGPQDGEPANQKAYELAVQWLTANSKFYWPRATSATSPYSLDPALLYDPEPGAGGDVLTRQYIRANTNPSDLYVQSPKDSVFSRMDADQSGVEGLFLTGDWTHNGINSGCAESAARSGWRCAQAVAGVMPALPK